MRTAKQWLSAMTVLLFVGCGEGLLDDEYTEGDERSAYHTQCGVMTPGQAMSRGKSMLSCDKRFRLSMQGDGNLVLYRLRDKKALWSSKTQYRGKRVVMQGDGNLVVYDDWNRAPWHSNTHGNAGAFLKLGNDGNLAIYKGKKVLWASKTRVAVPIPKCGVIKKGTVKSLSSCDKRFRLVMQADGNLVVYEGSRALWSAKTQYKGNRAVMQSDGNLVVYNDFNKAAWNTRTDRNPGAFLQLQNTGNLVVVSEAGKALWVSGSKGSAPIPKCGVLMGGKEIKRVDSCDKKVRLVMQSDGNLVVYRGSTPLWATGTQYRGRKAVLQGDGNLVIYDGWNRAVWSSRTDGNSGAYLVVQNDGRLVIKSKLGRVLYSR